MKGLFHLLFVTLMFLSLNTHAQWFRTRENATTQKSIYYRYWPGQLTSTLPTMWDFPDTGKTWVIYQDSIFIPRFAAKNDNPNAITFLTVNDTGKITGTSRTSMLSDVMKYTDTASALSPYVRALQASAIYYPITNPTGYITSAAIAGKLNSSDTTGKWQFKANYLLAEVDPASVHVIDSANMLTPYIRSVQANAALATKLNSTDTTNKWAFKANYLLAITSGNVTTALGFTPYNATNPAGYITGTSITGKVNVSDTALMLTPYAKIFQLLAKVNVADTNSMLSPYVKNFQLTPKLNISDTATMLSGYQRKVSVRRIETYLGTSDGSGNYTIVYSPAFATTPDVQPQLIGGTTQQMVRVTATSATGFTINATNRATVNLLSTDLLLGNTTALSGGSISVLVTSR